MTTQSYWALFHTHTCTHAHTEFSAIKTVPFIVRGAISALHTDCTDLNQCRAKDLEATTIILQLILMWIILIEIFVSLSMTLFFICYPCLQRESVFHLCNWICLLIWNYLQIIGVNQKQIPHHWMRRRWCKLENCYRPISQKKIQKGRHIHTHTQM